MSRSFERGKEAVCALPASGRNLLSRHLSLQDFLAAKLQNRKRKKSVCIGGSLLTRRWKRARLGSELLVQLNIAEGLEIKDESQQEEGADLGQVRKGSFSQEQSELGGGGSFWNRGGVEGRRA